MTSSSTSSSSSSELWIYDVFLSFRGENSRKNFVDHLYSALVQQGIYTYKDDEKLPQGEPIGPTLLKAIQESRIAIVVFSENYVDSSWCMDEVTYIMKCMDERGLIVMPIFYHVDPSDMRKQRGKFTEAFAKHELENSHKTESWKKALLAASDLSGWVTKDIANGHESKCIKEIVDTISHRLRPLISCSMENLIGIDSRMRDLKSKLEIGLGGVLMVGIWGVGGGGKTTVTSSVYDEISSKFDGCCFVQNIREESSKFGLEKLQEKILFGILKQKQVVIGRVVEGRHIMKRKLCHKKVLIVLDDVDHLDQLNALAGSHKWFGDGSRIIITTRNNHILNAHKVNVIYNVSLLNDSEGIELFCKHAFQDSWPIKGYELLLEDMVSYAGGLPLALKVLGSFLSDKDMTEWKSALARLKEIPDSNIVKKLKISYDGLEQDQKELFLDIACFFRGEKKTEAMEIFDACGFHPVIGIKVLIQTALITVSKYGCFDMHDMVQEMAHYIVKAEHPNNPEKYSRVWTKDDFQRLCAMDATTELSKIEAIKIISDMHDPLPSHHPQVVSSMRNLRWISWRHNSSSLPTNFPQQELRCLILSGGLQKQLWKGYKVIINI
ncbi:hypothetical protein R6Q57_015607 [Mikania cordata]